VLGLPPLDPASLPPLQELAVPLLGQSVFANWPMMHEGRVVGASDEHGEVTWAPDRAASLASWDAAAATSAAQLATIGRAKGPRASSDSSGNGSSGGGGSGGGSSSAASAAAVAAPAWVYRKFSPEESTAWRMEAADVRDE